MTSMQTWPRYSLVSMLTALVAILTCSTDGGVVLSEQGFTWRLPDGVTFDVSYDAGVGDGDWGRGAAGRYWNAKVDDESLWQLTRWSVPKWAKGLTAPERALGSVVPWRAFGSTAPWRAFGLSARGS